MENEKDFMKSPSHDQSEPEATFTILPSSVNTDINLGSLGDVPDNMAVTVDTSSLDPHLKVDGEFSSSQQAIIPENFVLVETSKGLMLSVADGSSDSISFVGNTTVADDQGRTIISSSLPGVGHNDDADIASIPDPVPRGVFKPVKPMGEPTYVAFDLETSDLRSIFTQIQPVGVIDEQHPAGYEAVSGGNNTVSSTTIPVYVDPDSTLNIPESTQFVSADDDIASSNKKKKGGGWPKGKKRKLIPNVEAPRKPMTGYVIFAVRRRREIKGEKPNLRFSEVTKVLGQEWSNLSPQAKNDYMKLAEEDKQRYITEMEEFQNSDLYQTFLKSKKNNDGGVKHFTDGPSALIDLEENAGMNELYCKVCNQYFISIHNKKEHMFGRSHLQNITNEIQKDIQKQAMLLNAVESCPAPSTFTVTTIAPDIPPAKPKNPSLDINDFIIEFLQKNSERDLEIEKLKKDKSHYEDENSEITKQIKELEEYETKLDQDLGNLKAYGASLSAQIDALKMVPTLFGVINF